MARISGTKLLNCANREWQYSLMGILDWCIDDQPEWHGRRGHFVLVKVHEDRIVLFDITMLEK
jgi:hypothetical protein